MESQHQEQLEALKDIRSMMERSSRFLSLSGLSGIWTGCCALAGVAALFIWLRLPSLAFRASSYLDSALGNQNWGLSYRGAFLLIGIGTFLTALAGAIFFSARRARRSGHRVWDNTAKRMVVGLLTPLSIGAMYCFALVRYDLVGLIAPTTLIFYGIALMYIDRFTIGNMRILGLAQVFLGVLGMFFPQFGLYLWAIGFGVLHILYGVWMYRKYEA
jgi:hypothetical protein